MKYLHLLETNEHCWPRTKLSIHFKIHSPGGNFKRHKFSHLKCLDNKNKMEKSAFAMNMKKKLVKFQLHRMQYRNISLSFLYSAVNQMLSTHQHIFECVSLPFNDFFCSKLMKFIKKIINGAVRCSILECCALDLM